MRTHSNSNQSKLKKIVSALMIMLLIVSVILPSSTVEASSNKAALNKKSATIYVGKTLKLKVNGTNKKVKWTSNKKSVATVSSLGKVKAKKKGTAKITAKFGNNKLTCKITVKNPSLNKTKLALEKGKTYTLKLKGNSVKKWSSNNKSVATVSSEGKVKAKKVGTATITCLSKNNKKYKCKVTVTNKNVVNTPTPKPNTTPGVTNTITPTVTPTPTPTHKPTATPTPTHTHNYKLYSSKSATCTTKGSNTYKCSSCGNTYTEEVAALNHSLAKTKKAASECYSAYDVYTCNRSNCDYSYKDYTNSYTASYLPTTLKDWEYTIYKEDGKLNLDSYIGTGGDIYIPGFMWIGGDSYQVTIGYKSDNAYNVFPTNIEGTITSAKLYDVKFYNAIGLFSGCSNMETVKLSNIYLNTDTSMERLFQNCTSLTTIDLSNMQVYNTYSLYQAFECCSKLTTVKFPDTSSIFGGKTIESLNLGYAFAGCYELTTLDLGNTTITNPSLGATFLMCESLKELDLTNLQGEPYTLNGTFQNCYELKTIKMKNLKPSSSTTCSNMLRSSTKIEGLYVSQSMYSLLMSNKSTVGNEFNTVNFVLSYN